MPLNFLNTGYFAAKVGIGTDSPDASLHINPATTNEIAIAINGMQNYSAGQFQRIAAGDASSLNRLAIGFGYDDPADWTIRYSSYGRHEFYTGNDWGNAANTEKMVITSAGNIGIGQNDPDYLLDLYKSTATTSSNDGTTLQRLWNYVGSDLQQQKTFIDFVFQDGNDNEYPQVRIGAEVGQNGNASTQTKEGSGAFVVYTNNATGDGPGTPTGLAERFRVDYKGDVGIGTNNPFSSLQVSNNTFSGGNGMAADSRVGISNHGILTGMMLASTYNDPDYPEYGLVFVQGASTSSYNVWSISPDGPAKGSGLSFIYKADATNIHNQTPQVYFEGSTGNVGIATATPQKKVHIEGTGAASEMQILVSSASDTVGHTAGIGLRGEGGESDGDLRIKGGIFFERIAGDYGNGKMILAVNSSVSNTSVTVADHALTIDTNKNVGIGTISPQMGLHVADTKGALFGPSGSGAASSYFSPSDENTLNGGYGQDTDSADIWLNYRGYQDGFTRFRDTRIGNGKGGLVAIFDGSAGNVGIGITGPQSKLHVNGGIQMDDDTDAAVVGKVGTMRYRTGTEYVEDTGKELITDGDFASSTYWGGTNAAVASGVATFTGTSGQESTLFQQNLTIVTTSGTLHSLTYTVVSNNLQGSAAFYAGFRTNNECIQYGFLPMTVGTHTVYGNSVGTGNGFSLHTSVGFTSGTLVIDNVSVYAVTAEDASYADMCMQTGASTYEWVNIVRNTY